LDETTLLVRLGASALIAAIIGLERELRGQVAGLRTHILVSVGACLFTLVGAYGFPDAPRNPGMDITRIASQVVVGVGFLGGGAILRHGASVRGLTTGANLWVAAALGVACGAGFYVAAGLTAAITVGVLSGLKPLERKIRRQRRHETEQPHDAHA
jgi:putative Mg2+ transporter-C (MgtC) family protein